MLEVMLASGILAAMAGSGALAPVPDPVPIVGGEPVEGETWRSTVLVDFGVDLCTGTLVTERVVLTAAHCLQSSPPAELVTIVLGNDRSRPERVLPVERYALHPDFCANPFECALDLHDYAYLVLAEPAPADAALPRLPLDQATWDAATVRTGTPVTLVGFGYDERLASGSKRAVDVEIRGLTESGLELFAGGDGEDGCHGDSGGPAYVRLPSGEPVLVGVSSRGLACGNGGYFGTTPAALCWIDEELGLPWDDGVCDVDTDPERGEPGCSIAAGGERPQLAWGLLLLAALRTQLRKSRRSPRPPRYSCRSASIGSSLAARIAG